MKLSRWKPQLKLHSEDRNWTQAGRITTRTESRPGLSWVAAGSPLSVGRYTCIQSGERQCFSWQCFRWIHTARDHSSLSSAGRAGGCTAAHRRQQCLKAAIPISSTTARSILIPGTAIPEYTNITISTMFGRPYATSEQFFIRTTSFVDVLELINRFIVENYIRYGAADFEKSQSNPVKKVCHFVVYIYKALYSFQTIFQ